MGELPLGYKLTWANWDGFVEGRVRVLRHGQKKAALPEAHSETFSTRGAAEARQHQLKAQYGDGLVACVAPLYLRPARRRKAPALMHLPPAVRRLTR